ncbi:HAMP domain-containing histidine kinase [bacterium]|nr:HAMP domain-containing histidine kinase [bacterium]
MDKPVETFFAPAERAQLLELRRDIDFAAQNPVIDGVLATANCILAVLNEHRQILAVNEELLKALGVENVSDVLGLRPGEAVSCVYAGRQPGGCGTSEYCETCGAAISIVTSLAQDEPVERRCAIQAKLNGKPTDLFFRVRCSPLSFEGHRLLLLMLVDISKQQQLAALERIFFHDIRNILTGLIGKSELLLQVHDAQVRDYARDLHWLIQRLAQEVEVQSILSRMELQEFTPSRRDVVVTDVLRELELMFEAHPAAQGKTIEFPVARGDCIVQTDPSLLIRVLNNMIVNALEASQPGDTVKVWLETSLTGTAFCVWNHQAIPPPVALRIFQRNYSTKKELGRGLGTFSMKLIGEEYLGGAVTFETSPEDGTMFRLSLPEVKCAG